MNQQPERRDLKRERIVEAQRLFRMAYALQLEGGLDRAVRMYEKSVRLHPTAEAMTYLAWARSSDGDLDEAITGCLAALQLDPEYPNAWNDIGAYLITKGKPEDSLFFLKRAIRLKRRTSRCFPHFNLHRAYMELGERARAIRELEASLDAEPDFRPALDALSELLFPGQAPPVDDDLLEPLPIGSPVLATAFETTTT